MKKMHIEILASLGSLAFLIVMIMVSKFTLPAPGYGFASALLLYVIMMSIAGFKLAEMPDKS